jgi:hypothetical protein
MGHGDDEHDDSPVFDAVEHAVVADAQLEENRGYE